MTNPQNSVEKIPNHIAIVMDGNGRWATARGLPRLAGHRQGVIALREILTACSEIGVRYLTVYAFSTENWRRDENEVAGLMTLLTAFLQSEIADLRKNNVRLRAIGDISRLPPTAQNSLADAVKELADNIGTTLVLALSYGSRDEIIRATKKIVAMAIAEKISLDQVEQIDESFFAAQLDTAAIPDPDLLIRTGGERRLSNFLAWQSSYAEIYFTDVEWPDFNREQLLIALADFAHRDRRFGKIKTI